MFTRSHTTEGETNLSHDGVVILDTKVEKTQDRENTTSDRPQDTSRGYTERWAEVASASVLRRRDTYRQLGRDLFSEIINPKRGAASAREVLCSLVDPFVKESRRVGTRSEVSVLDVPTRDGAGPIGWRAWSNRKLGRGIRAFNNGEARVIGLNVGGCGSHGSLTAVLVDRRRSKRAGSN